MRMYKKRIVGHSDFGTRFATMYPLVLQPLLERALSVRFTITVNISELVRTCRKRATRRAPVVVKTREYFSSAKTPLGVCPGTPCGTVSGRTTRAEARGESHCCFARCPPFMDAGTAAAVEAVRVDEFVGPWSISGEAARSATEWWRRQQPKVRAGVRCRWARRSPLCA